MPPQLRGPPYTRAQEQAGCKQEQEPYPQCQFIERLRQHPPPTLLFFPSLAAPLPSPLPPPTYTYIQARWTTCNFVGQAQGVQQSSVCRIRGSAKNRPITTVTDVQSDGRPLVLPRDPQGVLGTKQTRSLLTPRPHRRRASRQGTLRRAVSPSILSDRSLSSKDSEGTIKLSRSAEGKDVVLQVSTGPSRVSGAYSISSVQTIGETEIPRLQCAKPLTIDFGRDPREPFSTPVEGQERGRDHTVIQHS
eukprot:scaffold7172_cov113-Isochrysis_galbana.AAC.2